MNKNTTLLNANMSIRLINALSKHFDINLFKNNFDLNRLSDVDLFQLAEIGGVGYKTLSEFVDFLDEYKLNTNQIKLTPILKTNKKTRTRLLEKLY